MHQFYKKSQLFIISALVLFFIFSCNNKQDKDPLEIAEDELVAYINQQINEKGMHVFQPSGGVYMLFDSAQPNRNVNTFPICVELDYSLKTTEYDDIIGTTNEQLARRLNIYSDKIYYGTTRFELEDNTSTGINVGQTVYSNTHIFGLDYALAYATPNNSFTIAITAGMAFGATQVGKIPPYSNLIFEVHTKNVFYNTDEISEIETPVFDDYIKSINTPVSVITDLGVYIYLSQVGDTTTESIASGDQVTYKIKSTILNNPPFTTSSTETKAMHLGYGFAPSIFMNKHKQAKFKAIVPWNLMHGDDNIRGLPPYKNYIFDIEIIDIHGEK